MGKQIDLTIEERAIAMYLSSKGKSIREIASELRRSKTAVANCLKREAITGTSSYVSRENSGRKRKIDERTARKFVRDLKTKPELRRLPIARLNDELTKGIGLDISDKTLVRKFKTLGITSHIARKKPFITESHRKKRLAWAKEYRKFTVEDWKKVLWTDEASFSTDSAGKVRVWCKSDEIFHPSCTQATVKSGRKSIMVWGCINGDGVGNIHFMQTPVDGLQYAEVVWEVGFPMMMMAWNSELWQDDNAPIHRRKDVTSLKQELGMKCLPWPAQSPDLNPIENMWRDMKNWMNKNWKATDEAGLLEGVQKAFEALDKETIKGYIESMPRRVKAVIDNRGNATKW
jgi:transposase